MERCERCGATVKYLELGTRICQPCACQIRQERAREEAEWKAKRDADERRALAAGSLPAAQFAEALHDTLREYLYNTIHDALEIAIPNAGFFARGKLKRALDNLDGLFGEMAPIVFAKVYGHQMTGGGTRALELLQEVRPLVGMGEPPDVAAVTLMKRITDWASEERRAGFMPKYDGPCYPDAVPERVLDASTWASHDAIDMASCLVVRLKMLMNGATMW